MANRWTCLKFWIQTSARNNTKKQIPLVRFTNNKNCESEKIPNENTESDLVIGATDSEIRTHLRAILRPVDIWIQTRRMNYELRRTVLSTRSRVHDTTTTRTQHNTETEYTDTQVTISNSHRIPRIVVFAYGVETRQRTWTRVESAALIRACAALRYPLIPPRSH